MLFTSRGGGVVNAFSSVICEANFTSSKSITFFFAWFAYTFASSNIHVTYPKRILHTNIYFDCNRITIVEVMEIQAKCIHTVSEFQKLIYDPWLILSDIQLLHNGHNNLCILGYMLDRAICFRFIVFFTFGRHCFCSLSILVYTKYFDITSDSSKLIYVWNVMGV